MFFDDNVLEFMCQTAKEAGEKTVEGRKALNSNEIDSKATVKDIVTVCDRDTEKFIVSKLLSKFPDSGIYGEEFGKINQESPWCWIIDPIDGTASFVHNQPAYSVSIALWHEGQPVAGAVYAPKLNELYYGKASGGAWCNGEAIHVSSNSEMNSAMLISGFACLRAGWTNNNLPFFCKAATLAREIRRFGSAALDICFVASGKADAFWELNLALYDYAGAVPILLGAGGKVSDTKGNNIFTRGIICSNGVMHDAMVELLAEYDPD